MMILDNKTIRFGLLVGLASGLIGIVSTQAFAQPGTDSFTSSSKGSKATSKQVQKKSKLLSSQPQIKPKKPNAKIRSAVKISPDKKAQVIKFVRQNHAELENLLRSLEKRRPVQYQNAIRGLVKTYDRLQAFKKDTQRYDNALEDWKLKSRIQLAAARLATKETPQRRKQLEQLAKKQIDRRAKQLKLEIERLSKRTKRVETQLNKIKTNRNAEVKRLVDSAVKTSKRALVNVKPKSKSKPKSSGTKGKSPGKAKGERDAKNKNDK